MRKGKTSPIRWIKVPSSTLKRPNESFTVGRKRGDSKRGGTWKNASGQTKERGKGENLIIHTANEKRRD